MRTEVRWRAIGTRRPADYPKDVLSGPGANPAKRSSAYCIGNYETAKEKL
jgi:hypothetical protein